MTKYPSAATSAKVDFVVAGVQKCGTSALRHFLADHPEIGLPNMAEPHYFDRRFHHDKSGSYIGYHELYDDLALTKVTGDVTPAYIFLHPCLHRISAYNPNMKVIVLLRNPIFRAYSQWNMQVDMRIEKSGFAAALLKEPWRYLRYGQHPYFSYIQRGFYAPQLQRLFATFPRENCLILKQEDFKAQHEIVLEQVYQFLGVSCVLPPPRQEIHARRYAPMPAAIRAVLERLFRKDIRKTERLLGWDCSDWLGP